MLNDGLGRVIRGIFLEHSLYTFVQTISPLPPPLLISTIPMLSTASIAGWLDLHLKTIMRVEHAIGGMTWNKREKKGELERCRERDRKKENGSKASAK